MPSRDIIERKGSGEDYAPSLTATFFLFLMGFLLLGGRLWYLQVVKGEKFRRFSQENRIELRKKIAPRGIILDRYGKIIADNRPSFDLVMIRGDLDRPINVMLKDLSKLLGPDNFDIDYALDRLKKVPGRYRPVVIKYDLSPDEVSKIEVSSFRLPGVRVELRPVRKYLHGKALCHLLGTVGEINRAELSTMKKKYPEAWYRLGDFIGKSGIERAFEHFLRGRDGEEPVVLDAHGREIKGGEVDSLLPVFRGKNSVPGNDLVLTIDLDLQLYAESIFEYQRGAVVAVDPRTGEVLAMFSRPAFDPSKFSRGVSSKYWKKLISDPGKPLTDRTVQGQYPPGSTYKVVPAAAALEEGIISPSKTFYCSGTFRLGRETKRCWKAFPGHGEVDIRRAVKESCDVYFYNVGKLLGVDLLAEYARNSFGFGSPTGIGINREKKGLVPDSKWKEKVYKEPWVGGETLSVAIGQGYVLVTPIQLAMAYVAIANGGRLLKPQLVREIKSPSGGVIKNFSVVVKKEKVLSSKTLKILIDALTAVVNEKGGTAYWTGRSKRVKIGGKTGTAQVVSRIVKGKGPSHLRDHSWFVGFAPVDDPKIVVAAIAENAGHGSSAAAPLVKRIIEYYWDHRLAGELKSESAANSDTGPVKEKKVDAE